MTKKNAWKVEPELADRFLDVLTNYDYKWMSGHVANEFCPLQDDVPLLFIEGATKRIYYTRYFSYPDNLEEEYNITEVTKELLELMESEGVTRTYTHDPVNHPSHYNHGELETITIIEMLLTEEEYRGYLKGNILKYRERAPYKGNAEQDYEKAKWYFDELLKIGF